MGKRTNLDDTAGKALVLLNKYTGLTMIKYDQIEEFDRIINQNLDEMNSQSKYVYYPALPNDFYYVAVDQDGTKYAIMYPNADVKKAYKWYICTEPYDKFKALFMSNALSAIGLEVVNNEIVRKKPNKELTLSKKE